MKKATLVLVVLFAALINSAFAQEPSVMLSNEPGWHKIGEVKADFKTEMESISVLGKDRFKSILLKVTDAPINILDVEVFYETGETEKVDVANELKANSETRKIDLRGKDKEIQKVT